MAEDSRELGEAYDESSLSFRSLTVTTRTPSSVILHWDYVPICDSPKELVFKLLKLESRDEWKTISWTRKTTCTIDNLEQNICYSLQILVLAEDEDEFKVVDESDVFKVRVTGGCCRWR